MKIAKKILVGMLALAVLASCMMLSVSAEDPHFDYSASYAEGTFSSVLEYYEQNLDVDFNIDGTAVGSAYPDSDAIFTQSGASITVGENNGDKYVAISGPQNNTARFANAFLKWTAENELNGVILDFDICAAIVELPGGVSVRCTARGCSYVYDPADPIPENGGTCPNNHVGKLKVEVKDTVYRTPVAHVLISDVAETSAGEAANTGFELFVFDSKNDEFSYGTVVDGAFTYVTPADSEFDYDPNAWYSVSVAYNAVSKTYSFTVTNKADPTNTLTKTDVPASLESVRTVKIGSSASSHENNDTTVMLDNLTAQGGSFDRTGKDRQTISDEYVVHFGSDINIVDLDSKAKIIDVYSRMVAGGYSPVSADAVAAVRHIALASFGQVESYVAKVDTTASYDQRLAAYNSYLTFIRVIPTDDALDGFDADVAERMVAARTVCNNEATYLETTRADSLFVAERLSGFDAHSSDYAYLSPIYNAIKDKLYDSTVPGATNAAKAYGIITSVFPEMVENGDAFIANVAAAEPTDAVAFGVSYGSFVKARAGYFDNITYPGIADNGTEEGALKAYVRLAKYYAEYEAYNDLYNKSIHSAGLSTYVNARKELLETAYALTLPEDGAPDGQQYNRLFKIDYPGVAESMLKYAELKKTVDDLESAAAAYIEAVTALAGLEGQALIDGIKVAEELQKTGNVSGIAGVDLANIYLDNLKTELTLKLGYSEKFVKLVGYLATAKTLSERYAIISELLTIDESFLGTDSAVTAAKATLASAITAYNAEVAAINAALLGTAK